MQSFSNATNPVSSPAHSLTGFGQLWWAWYDYWQNDIVATGIITFVTHEIVYFTRCIPWMIADAVPSVFLKYKIQGQKLPRAAQQWECAKAVLLIHFVIEMPLFIGFHPAAHFFGMKTLLFFIMEDTFHYWIHRFLHWGPMYRKVHRIHHEYSSPFGLAAEYASLWETLLLGAGTIGAPMLFSALTGRLHLLSVIAWVTCRQFQAINAHSGYDFPWSFRHWLPIWGGADWHDDHHRYFHGNYSSSFRYWDVWMDTVAGPVAGAKRRARKDAKMLQSTREAELASLMPLEKQE